MKIKFWNVFVLPALIASMVLISTHCAYSLSDKAGEQDQLFNSAWKFIRDSIPGAELPGYDDSAWLTVDLPHDYSIMDLPGEDGEDQIGPFSKESPGNGNTPFLLQNR